MTPTERPADPYLQAFEGGFSGVLRWHQLDDLWERLRAKPEGWFAYALGEAPPTKPLEPADLDRFLSELDRLIRAEHGEDYCGIVYADSLQNPDFVKVYDPNNLGAVCGSSGVRTLPGWTLSRLRPVDLHDALPAPGNRRRWWQRLFGSA
ncbi:MAG: hypothetical protein KDH88_10775 [Chromatiales bacterium]|nr:hypothetical protein [Chromatiales bacterium]